MFFHTGKMGTGDGCVDELDGGNPFTICTYITSPRCKFHISYNYICQLYLNKAENKKGERVVFIS